ncbi:peroxide stress protein YaaA [Microbacterium sp. ET2]|uniref:YaaA family protein n=1 Tax=Microbacterium albipurpureum TaxID=3050384 RepID=UPI00259CE994|nr:peroxide stress protein YaaA [Microbacterium sp. ET2 (Ac-2212)]WJL95213.1 peroxide stress protein YaaA [Microbacterium sp. ET2 (Ac-2212)]
MLILLPPSETKQTGGRRRALDLDSLSLPSLGPQREEVLAALTALSDDADEAARVLKLGPRQRDEVAVNALLRTAPTLPAVDRYTGVLFDALDAPSLDASARRWLRTHVFIHSAPFGPVGALDPIPNYRLKAGVRLPGLAAPSRHWAAPVATALATMAPPFILDLRSHAYVALGPVPASVPAISLRVVTDSPGGAVRALNHFNKHAKGALVRRLAVERPRIRSVSGLRQWADAAGLRLLGGSDSAELDLIV